jgi:acyl-coenzyme A thioesterase 13
LVRERASAHSLRAASGVITGKNVQQVKAIPPDFEPIASTSPFLDSVGRFYAKGVGAEMRLGVVVERRACNRRGRAHGGFLAGLADIALGYALGSAQDPPPQLLTSSLAIDFAGSAACGEWIETSVDLQHIGRTLGFANAYLHVAQRRIVRASGVFTRVSVSP